MRYFGCCVVDCGEVEGCAAITVLYVDHPASVTAASWKVGGGSVGGGGGVVQEVFDCGEVTPRHG